MPYFIIGKRGSLGADLHYVPWSACVIVGTYLLLVQTHMHAGVLHDRVPNWFIHRLVAALEWIV